MDRRIVVVTGASAGIGRATALAFGRRGWRVALLARSPQGLEGAVRDVERVGGEPMAIEVDVADASAVEAAAERIERDWGPIDVWVNNAMATVFCEALDVAPEDFRRVTEVTYLGAVWGTLAALRRMKRRNRGAIVQVGSALAYRSIPLQSAYCGAKSALRGFTDSLRSELIHDRSRVHLTMVHLAAFNTPQFDWARSCLPNRAQPLGKIFSPRSRPRASTGPRSIVAGNSGSAGRRSRPSWAPGSCPAFSIESSRSRPTLGSRPASPSRRAARTISMHRCPATGARTDASTTGRSTAACSFG